MYVRVTLHFNCTARVSVYCIVIPVVSCYTQMRRRESNFKHMLKTAVPAVPHDADWIEVNPIMHHSLYGKYLYAGERSVY